MGAHLSYLPCPLAASLLARGPNHPRTQRGRELGKLLDRHVFLLTAEWQRAGCAWLGGLLQGHPWSLFSSGWKESCLPKLQLLMLLALPSAVTSCGSFMLDL